MARQLRMAGIAVLVTLLAGLILWWRSRPDGRLHVLFPAVKGDAVMIITPNGRVALIDGGARPADAPQILGRRLPVWQRNVDLLILTGAAPERLPGVLAIARRYQVKVALLPSTPQTHDERLLYTLLAERGTTVQIASAGAAIELDGIRLVVQQAGGGRLALRLTFGMFTGLLAPAAQPGDLQALASPAAQLLFYPWSTPDDRVLAQQLNAQVVVYSEGKPEAEHQPYRRTFFERGSTERLLLHEQLNGTIELISDGQHLWVEPDQQWNGMERKIKR